jgi:hypothetical protein
MVSHPSVHLQIARQRHQDLLAEAERRRTAQPFRHAGVRPAPRRSQRRTSASPYALNPGVGPHSDGDIGLEV